MYDDKQNLVPLAGQAKQNQEIVRQSSEQIYNEMVKKEQSKLDEEFRKKAQDQFDPIRKMGFATTGDVETYVQASEKKITEMLEQDRIERNEFLEKLARARAQGAFNIPEKTDQTDMPQVYNNRPFLKEMIEEKRRR